MHVWEAREADVYFPLQCLIDYLGFRLVAMLHLPLAKDTLRGTFALPVRSSRV